jgi:hypothetical protein
MGHGGMDHGDMPGMEHGPKCDMNMYVSLLNPRILLSSLITQTETITNRLWNTQIVDTCIIFRSWHISSTFTLLLSIVIIILIGIGYEYTRVLQGRLDKSIARGIINKRALNAARSGGGGEGYESPGEEALLVGRGSKVRMYVIFLRSRECARG